MAAVSLLRTEGLTQNFGGLRAVDGVDFEMAEGEVRAIIGPNGAGKTTFVGLLSGRFAPGAGRIFFRGRDVTRLPAHARARLGIAYTFQIASVFDALSLFDNVALAAQRRHAGAALGRIATATLERVGLDGLAGQPAQALSHGHKRLLEVAMGLAQEPRLLILDEPTQGLAEGDIEAFVRLVRGIVGETTVLLIEHNMDVVLSLAERVTVLDRGRVLAEDAPDAILADPAVQVAYLGAQC